MHNFFLLSVLVAQALLGISANNNAFDHVTMEFIPEGVRWLEVGFFTITPTEWTTVTATYRNFVDPVVFLSSPQLDGETSDEGTAMSLRIRNVNLNRISAFTSVLKFQAKSYNVNSTYCSTRHFYTPADLDIPNSNIGWLAVEKGKFNVSNKAFIISTDTLNRTTELSDDKVNLFKSIAPLGICDYGQNCRIEGDNTTLLMIAQIQTLRFDRYLLMRGVEQGPDYVVVVLQTADSLDPAGYVIPSPGEDYAWMLFETGVDTNCVENLVIESYLYLVTYLKLSVSYINTFTQPPAIFGLINTLVGRDSTSLRSFNLEVNGADFLTQEDKCRKEETNHVFQEKTAILVVGRADSSADAVTCGATFNWDPPTTEYCVEVALYDTFGDGWGNNVALKIWSDDRRFNATYIYNDCANSSAFPNVVCYPANLDIYFDIVTFEEPATETWEMYWTVRTLGEKGYDYDADGNLFESQWYLGDYDTNMTAFNAIVDVFNPVDYMNQTCDVCKHPPKPKPKASPSVGKSSSSGSKSGPHSHEERPSKKSSGESSEATTSNYTSLDSEDYSGTLSNATLSNATSDSGESVGFVGNGKMKPKPPHWPFPVMIFDSNGDGWFNSSEAWVMVPQYECDGNVTYHDNLRLPEVLTNPEYTITNSDRTEVLRRNTICGDLLKETCEERLPDGEYIFRVGGALSRDDSANTSSWEFCGTRGRSMEELQFKMKKGKCVRGEKINARDICCADGSNAALFDGMLLLSNVAGDDLTEYDTILIEAALAESFSTVHGQLQGSVALSSWELQGSALMVSFRLSVDPTSLGVQVNNYEYFEALTPELLTSGQTFAQAGNFLTNLQHGLADFSIVDESVLTDASGATLLSLEYLTISHSSAAKSIYTVASAELSPDSSLSASAMTRPQEYKMLSSFERTLIVVVACVVGVALVAKVVTVATRRHDVSDGDFSGSGSPLMLDKSSSRAITDGELTGTHSFAKDLAPEMVPDFN